jgi:hypothetical protein
MLGRSHPRSCRIRALTSLQRTKLRHESAAGTNANALVITRTLSLLSKLSINLRLSRNFS